MSSAETNPVVADRLLPPSLGDNHVSLSRAALNFLALEDESNDSIVKMEAIRRENPELFFGLIQAVADDVTRRVLRILVMNSGHTTYDQLREHIGDVSENTRRDRVYDLRDMDVVEVYGRPARITFNTEVAEVIAEDVLEYQDRLEGRHDQPDEPVDVDVDVDVETKDSYSDSRESDSQPESTSTSLRDFSDSTALDRAIEKSDVDGDALEGTSEDVVLSQEPWEKEPRSEQLDLEDTRGDSPSPEGPDAVSPSDHVDDPKDDVDESLEFKTARELRDVDELP